MKTRIIISFLLCSSLLQAQQDCDCYDRLMQLAYYHFAKENHPATLEALSKALNYKEQQNWSSTDYWMLTHTHLRLKKVNSAFEFAKSYLLAVGDQETITGDTLLMAFLGEENEAVLNNELAIYQKAYQSNLQLDYLLRLERITGTDQAIRSYLKVEDTTFRKLDSIHLYQALALIEEFGFPERAKHGFGAEKMEHLFLHGSLYSEKMLKDIMEVLNAAQEKGLLSQFFIAQIVDRREVWMKQQPQRLGVWNSWRNQGQFSPIKSIEKLDEQRFEYNLLRLKEQGEMENRVLPEGYIPAAYPPDYFCGMNF